MFQSWVFWDIGCFRLWVFWEFAYFGIGFLGLGYFGFGHFGVEPWKWVLGLTFLASYLSHHHISSSLLKKKKKFPNIYAHSNIPANFNFTAKNHGIGILFFGVLIYFEIKNTSKHQSLPLHVSWALRAALIWPFSALFLLKRTLLRDEASHSELIHYLHTCWNWSFWSYGFYNTVHQVEKMRKSSTPLRIPNKTSKNKQQDKKLVHVYPTSPEKQNLWKSLPRTF